MKPVDESPKAIHRLDYQPPAHQIPEVHLQVDIHHNHARVKSLLQVEARDPEARAPLVLNGVDLELLGLKINGEPVAAGQYRQEGERLLIEGVPARCALEVEVRIDPWNNTALEGFYRSGDFLLTQCEAEGFRKITFFPDRPDVMSVFTVTLEADQARFPVLLSNGNLVDSGDAGQGRHFARWHDPIPKPCYLFAMVAGDLAHIEDHFTTADGREVLLRIYTEQENLDQCDFAMASLKKAMRWDEERFGLIYDLDIFNIVVTNDFNMGAMENKSLNIFNSVYVLARPDTATDANFAGIEAVIGHEYFHNWTGNRVTCRDWFQLSLKEGLTVFRDQEFSSDLQSRAVKRIEDVRFLRASQFPEDAGPMAHPIRPDSYIEINNFYTLTVYEKGAEVVRMYHTLLGEAGFRKGMDLYFQRHDGQAVTCDDFRQAMADANGVDLSQFERWYSQAGTPEVEISEHWDGERGELTLTLRQHTPPTPGQAEKQPLHMPFAVGLLDSQGRDLPVQLAGETEAPAPGTRVLDFTEAEQRFVFTGLNARPVVSAFRNFSAPIKRVDRRDPEALAFLMAHDSDAFNRWDAAQQLACDVLLARLRDPRAPVLPEAFLAAFRTALLSGEDPALIAETLTLPAESYLAELVDVVDPAAIHQARRQLKQALAQALEDEWHSLYQQLDDGQPYAFTAEQVARRSLKNTALGYLAECGNARAQERVLRQWQQADNMTDQLAALTLLVHQRTPGHAEALAEFRQRWVNEPLVLDKWFSLQAACPDETTLEQVQALMRDAAFSMENPNKVRALVGAFCRNAVNFHRPDGAGYTFLAERVLELNRINPQIASRMVSFFNSWKRLEPGRREKMRQTLERIAAEKALARDVYEIVSKALAD